MDTLFAGDEFGGDPAKAAVVGYAQVALEQGIDRGGNGLTYAVPANLADLVVGDRVMVPLGRGDKPTSGYVVERVAEPGMDAARVKPILRLAEGAISLTPDLIELARWMAAYYCCPLGMVLVSLLPAAVKKGTGTFTELWVSLTEAGAAAARGEKPAPPAAEDGEPEDDSEAKSAGGTGRLKLPKLQRHVLEVAADLAEAEQHWLPLKELADTAGAKTTTPLKQLIEKGLLRSKREASVRAAEDDLIKPEQQQRPGRDAITLTDQQHVAVDALDDALETGFSVHLLHGITGSGKTEVYLRVIDRVKERLAKREQLAQGAAEAEPAQAPGVIVLVPEIALTPQTVAWFVGRFDNVAVLHSGLTAAQRHEQWRRIREGKASIVVGARSAIFAPVPNVQLIIVDEEHESSYKQDQLPRYHARDVAIKRGQILGVPVVLGSATPSLESYYNAVGVPPDPGLLGGPIDPDSQLTDQEHAERRDGQAPGDQRVSAADRRSDKRVGKGFNLIELPSRAGGGRLPRVEIVDLVEERRHRRGIHLLSQRLEELLRSTFAQKGQALLLLNRRGYANYIACPDHRCGWMKTCDHCDAVMIYHKGGDLPRGGVVRCHHCSAEQLLPTLCPEANCGKKITVFGLGVQRVEEEVQNKFGDVRMLRMDSDAMRTGRDYHEGLTRFRQGELDLLVGTQMIAKGLDFPNVRAVGVISADTSLNLPDFRASERTFQLVAQVAGRAGRGEHPGTVVVQTFSPDDPAITLAAKHDYATFAAHELNLRAQVGLPPISRMARIVTRDRDHTVAYERAGKLMQSLNHANKALGDKVRLRGPSPCPIARIADFHRNQIELIAPDAATMQKLLTAARNTWGTVSDAHTAIDVDPVALL